MKVAVRVDASAEIGIGHFMRCRNLATELRRRGADVRFIGRGNPDTLNALLDRDGIAHMDLAGPFQDEDSDAAQTVQALHDKVDAVIVDHYKLGAAWEGRIRAQAALIVAIDDAPHRAHDADILIDQNFSLSPATRYAAFTPATCRTLLGPRYAILGPDYVREGTLSLAHPAAAQRLLISFGGADPGDMTGAALAALSDADFAALHIDVVVGNAYPFRARLAEAVARRPRTTLHVQLPSLAPLLQAAHLAIGAGGISTWERLSFGVPTILVSIADNQLPASTDLATAGMALHLGAQENLPPGALAAAVRSLMNDAEARAQMSLRGQLAVDGFGAHRIAELLCPTPRSSLRLRPATLAHVGYLYELANLPDVRAQSFSESTIPWPEHLAWLTRKQADIDADVWILEANRLPIGQVRIDRRGGDGVLSYSLDPIVRGRGWGHRLVELGLSAIRTHSVARIVAEVKPDNMPSRAILERLGFGWRLSERENKITFARN